MADVTATVMTFADCEVEWEKIYGLSVKKSVVSLDSSYYKPYILQYMLNVLLFGVNL